MFKTTELICRRFDEENYKDQVEDHGDQSEVITAFPVLGGPNVIAHYISYSNNNDVAVRIFGQISRIPRSGLLRVMKACNSLNRSGRYMKFYVDDANSINVEYDFPVTVEDNNVGAISVEIPIRMIHILGPAYDVFMRAPHMDMEIAGEEEIADIMRESTKRMLAAADGDMDSMVPLAEEFSTMIDTGAGNTYYSVTVL